MKGRAIIYSAAEMAWLQANRLLPIGDYHAAFAAAFGRPDVTAINLHSLRKRKGWRTGRTGHFVKGQVSHNKGQRCPDDKGGRHPNARATQFRKGQEPHNTRHLGHERLTKDGYVMISVAQTNPHTGYHRHYVLKQRWLWEQANGPLGDGMVLKCLDGNKANCDPSNWEAIPREVLPLLNGGRHKKRLAYDAAEPEIKPIVMAAAKLRAASRKAKERV